jgi:aryl-alcohol dehydrogenase-like predicted oxidoreductase
MVPPITAGRELYGIPSPWKSGLKVSEFSSGSWVTFGKQVDGSDAVSLMAHAYDNGVNFFDKAEGYEIGKIRTCDG